MLVANGENVKVMHELELLKRLGGAWEFEPQTPKASIVL